MSLVIRETGIQDFLGEGGERLHVKALIMGPPSAGKTRSASYWPRPIFADCEKGRMSIADRSMPYGEILTSADMEAMLGLVARECRKAYADRKYQTLVIDTVDSYQRIVMQERLDSEKKASFSGWADWGFLDAKMTQLLAKMLALPMNIVVNLHVKDTKIGDDDAAILVTGPKLKGDIKDQIAAEFDLVGYMGTYWEAEGGVRVLKRGVQWQPDPTKPILKDRSGQLPQWTNVDFTAEDYWGVYNALTGHLDNLREGEVLETLETETAAQPMPPSRGGPVAEVPEAPTPRATKRPAKKAAPTVEETRAAVLGPDVSAPTGVDTHDGYARPPRAAVPAGVRPTNTPAGPPESGADTAPAVEVDGVGEVDTTTGEVTAPDQPDEPPKTEAEAIGNVVEGLGAEVISTPEAVDGGGSTEAPASASEVMVGVICGTALDGGSPPAKVNPWPVPGCGKTIILDTEGGQDNHDLVEIAELKTRTHLCPACFQAWRMANR